MGCENKSCDRCACDKNTVPETIPEEHAVEGDSPKPMLKQFPMAQKRDVVYVERKKVAETGFWGFFWGMLFGSFFLGC